MALPVALQLYSVRDEAAADFVGTLKAVKAMGYDGVELCGVYAGYSAEEIRGLCADIGLTPISAHSDYDTMLKDPDGVFAYYAAIGCKYVAVPYLPPEYRPGTEEFFKVVKNIGFLGEVAKKHGLKLIYHNHDFEFVDLDGKYALDYLYDTIPAELLATELDTCWVNVGGENPAKYLLKYTGRAPVVHLKDFWGEKSENMYELIGRVSKAPEKPKNFEYRPLGQGLQDFPAILAAAEQAGSEWVVVEQDSPSMGLTPMECAAKSREYLGTLGY